MSNNYTILAKAHNLATLYKCSVDDIFGKRRLRNVVKCRHILFWYMYNVLDMSYTEVGKVFNVDHTTIMNGVKNIDFYRHIEDDIAGALSEIYQPFTSLAHKP